MSRLNLKPAAEGRSNYNFQPSTIASLDFGEIVPVRCIETLDGASYDSVHADGVIRLAPQVFPPYGKCFIKNAAFFVPKYQLIEYADAFQRNMKTWKGKPCMLPKISALNFLVVFSQSFFSSNVYETNDPSSASIPSVDAFDFIYPYDNAGTVYYQYRKLNSFGRKSYKLLKGLGYDFPSVQTGATFNAVKSTIGYSVNALPLLAYFKIYADMFLTGAEYNNSELVLFLQKIHDGESYIDSNNNNLYNAATGYISDLGFDFLLRAIFVPHEQNMYTEAWNSVNSPLGVNPSSELTSINPSSPISPYNDHTLVSNSSQDSIAISGSLSALGVKMLLAFDKFVKRHNLSGSRAAQRVYSAFGVKTDDFRSNYVRKLYEGAERIKFSPVMSNADTKSANGGQYVGDYAGFGVSGLNFDFNYNVNDYGYIICLTWIQVVPMLLRGFNPDVLRIEPFDFFTPEYDGQSYRAIPKMEIAVNKKLRVNVANNDIDTSVYGFTNVYEEYRNQRDSILGDFVVGNSKNYLFCRDLSVFRSNPGWPELHPQQRVIQYYQQLDMQPNDNDMSDPFQMAHSNGDRFWLELNWDIKCSLPIKSESDSYGLGVGDVTIQKNGNQMN